MSCFIIFYCSQKKNIPLLSLGGSRVELRYLGVMPCGFPGTCWVLLFGQSAVCRDGVLPFWSGYLGSNPRLPTCVTLPDLPDSSARVVRSRSLHSHCGVKDLTPSKCRALNLNTQCYRGTHLQTCDHRTPCTDQGARCLT